MDEGGTELVGTLNERGVLWLGGLLVDAKEGPAADSDVGPHDEGRAIIIVSHGYHY